MTMLEEAVERVSGFFGKDNVYIAASSALRDPILEAQIVPEANVWSEPTRRNTLGGHCWVAANLAANDLADASVAVLTADHLIGDTEQFLGSLGAALDIAEMTSGIVTIGIEPTRPETGYGYIEVDDSNTVTSAKGRLAYRAHSFREKPSADTADRFLEAGNFLWNSGMFIYTLPTFKQELEKAQPAAYESVGQIAEALKKGDLSQATASFEDLPNISIDYAVMEKAERVFVVRSDFKWDDVGTWDAMERTRELDPNGNVVEGRVLTFDSHNCVVISQHPDLTVGVLGLSNMVVVASDESVLVCHKNDVQRVWHLARMDVELRKTL